MAASFASFRRRLLPSTLFARSLMIVSLPILILQMIVAFVFFDRHWDSMSDKLVFGLAGEISRTVGDDGLDVVHVSLRKADLERVPESRIHTALEASLNCEVHIRTV